MGFLTRSRVLDRMYCLERDVAIALAPFQLNVEVTVLGSGWLAFTPLNGQLKLDQERLRVEAKVKRAGLASINARRLSGLEHRSYYNAHVPIADASKLIVDLLVFESEDPSAVDKLGALESPF